MKRFMILGLGLGLAAAAGAQTGAARLPNYSKTLTELAATAPTGGAGGSGNAKIPRNQARMRNSSKSARTRGSRRTTMPATVSALSSRVPGTSATVSHSRSWP